jgi:GrpB-like predicted nucleotidyltransferase (UPF0157 family)
MSRVQVVEYDPEWPGIFERVRSYVWPAVSDIALSVEHVGSTAVAGMSAKPVIDACIVVASRNDVSVCVDRLASIGYVHRGNLGVPDRQAFRRPDQLPRHHLYLSPRDSLSLKNHLGLRDYLRSHPKTAQEYGELKTSLARRFPSNIDRYLVGKTELILRILGEIGLKEDELAQIRRINQMDNVVRPNPALQPPGPRAAGESSTMRGSS